MSVVHGTPPWTIQSTHARTLAQDDADDSLFPKQLTTLHSARIRVGEPTTIPAAHLAVSAQCPACGLHELIAIHLRRAADGRWQTDEREIDDPSAVQIDTCPVCNGAWFDPGELDRLAGEHARLESYFTHERSISARVCPHGHGTLFEFHLEALIDTPIDRCATCGGIWLDGSERRKLAAASTKEGQQSSRERLLKRGAIWAAQLLTHMPVEVENPARGTPWMVFSLVAVLVVCFVLQLYEAIDTYAYGVVAGRLVRQHDFDTLLSYQFLHGSWVHLLGNLYFLYTFGDNIEYLFGRARFVMFFLATGVLGGLAHALLTHATAMPVVGASGAISGILAAYLWTFPRAELLQLVLYIQLRIPVWVYLFVWVGLHVLMGLFSQEKEVAWFAHLGGFLSGVALTPILLKVRRYEVAKRVRVPAWTPVQTQ